jgi:hypothetical protein
MDSLEVYAISVTPIYELRPIDKRHSWHKATLPFPVFVPPWMTAGLRTLMVVSFTQMLIFVGAPLAGGSGRIHCLRKHED